MSWAEPSRRRRSAVVPGLVAVLLVAAGALAGCSGAEGSAGQVGYVAGEGTITVLPPPQRQQPGEVSGTTLSGKQVSLDDYAGQTVVVNVWGSWCAPCRAEADDLRRAYHKLRSEDVAFLGIDARDPDKDAARAFLRRFNVPYPSIYDENGDTLLAFHDTLAPNTIPSTVVIDARGRVAASILGQTTTSTLMGVVRDVKQSTETGSGGPG